MDLTLDAMAAAGVHVVRHADKFVVPHSVYRAGDYSIEADASAASYFFAAAAIAGGRVSVEGLGGDSKQGDLRFVDILAEMGCTVTKSSDRIEFARDPAEPLRGVTVDMGDCSDVAQTLACVAPFADGPTTISGIGFVRSKETDRIGSVVTELRRCGIDARERTDGYEVLPGRPASALVQTYGDHRMAMSFALLGLRTSGIRISDPDCVAKTFPGYWDALESIRPLRAIAIDGVLGSGKTTVAKAVAARLHLEYLDTGAMYRSVGLACVRRGWPLERAGELAASVAIDVGERVTLDGEDVTDAIRTPEASRAASAVATQQPVRRALVEQQRAWARRRGGGVLEGRDIATVVLPNAPVKVYLTASVEERARRRQLQHPEEAIETVMDDLLWRDHNDLTREVDPLQIAAGATVVDTTGLSIGEVVEAVVELVPWEGK